MAAKNYSSEEGHNDNVNVIVDVSKIIKYLCITSVLIVSIIFGTNCYKKMLDKNFFSHKK